MTTTSLLLRPLIAILLLLPATIVIGADNDYRALMTLNVADGLAGESVYHVMTDHGGRVWMGTVNGINMYNGKQLTCYRLSDEHHRQVTVYMLCETRSHDIYAATDIGLFKLSLSSSRFERTLPEVQRPECLMAVGDTVFIGGRQGMQVFDGKRLTTIHLGESRKGIDNVVRHYVQDEKGQIWLLGRYELYLYHPSTGELKAQNITQLLPERATPSQFAIVGNKCFVGTKTDGFYVIDLKLRTVKRINQVGHIVTSVCRSSDGYICVATNGAGAFLLDAQTGAVVCQYDAKSDGAHRLQTNALNCYYRDAQGVDWFGQVRYGLSYVYHTDSLFQLYAAGDFTTAGLNVRSYCLHGDESVIGTYHGIYYVKDGKTHFFSPDKLGGSHIVNNIVYYRGEYYIGTFDSGMGVLNPQTLTIRRLDFAPSLQKAAIGDLEIGPDGLLWVGTGDGLFLIDNQKVHKWFTEQNSHIQGGMILDITFDQGGNAWLTGSEGLSFYSGQVKDIIDDPNFPDNFFHHQPWCRGFIGHDSLVYMRNGPQVFFTDYKMKHYGEFVLPVSLPDVWCRSFIDDWSGHFWLNSEMGLFRVDYDGTNMVRLGSGSGLKGSHINELSYDGHRLWIATSEGLYHLLPSQFESWANHSSNKINLFNIRRGSTMFSSGEELIANDHHQLELNWNLGTEPLLAEAVLLDYADPSGRLYEYCIDNTEWHTVLPHEQIALSGLSLGHHELCVRLAGISGTTTCYDVVVRPSLLAIIELLVLVVLLILLWIGYRYRKHTKVLLTERDEIEDALIAVEHELVVMTETDGSHDAVKSEKYQKVKLNEAECEEIVSRMRYYIEQTKVYRHVDLKMKDLADELHLSPSKLSQVFNLYLNENYYDFINHYRLEEFKRLVDAGEHKKVTITALSEQCGFKKSSFFSTFRKVEGMTPAEYMKNKS